MFRLLFTLIVNFYVIYADNIKHYTQSCNTCKWFIPNINDDYGKCKMFGEKTLLNEDKNRGKKGFDLINYNYAKHCRENENQCGKYGYFYEKNNLIDEINNKNRVDELKIINSDLYYYTKFLEKSKL